MKYIICDNCKQEIVVDSNFKKACKQLNEVNWEKVGFGIRFGIYCSICAMVKKHNMGLKK